MLGVGGGSRDTASSGISLGGGGGGGGGDEEMVEIPSCKRRLLLPDSLPRIPALR